VRRLLSDQTKLSEILLPMLDAWCATRLLAARLARQIAAEARQNDGCRILMSIPGVGAITATSFVTAIESADNFQKSRSVGAWVGLTTRRYQSGEIDYKGHISRRGDHHLRGLLYQGAEIVAEPERFPVIRSGSTDRSCLSARSRVALGRSFPSCPQQAW
jgi:transposase